MFYRPDQQSFPTWLDIIAGDILPVLPPGSHFGHCSLSQNVESDSSVSDFLLIEAQTELIIDGQLKAAEQLGHANAKGSQLLYLRFFYM